ncbi:hypothetical protein UCMB321_0086 [Pseudomonas batumici]|uniref:Uncharacterized protein n=1 Tax=Pseudomonas batumici TaxID=226910 RepID=A0A0C2F5B4_9PSED|nr:hypothetical protein UCMB321_0086 [Pseudomonas batumici]
MGAKQDTFSHLSLLGHCSKGRRAARCKDPIGLLRLTFVNSDSHKRGAMLRASLLPAVRCAV